LVYEMLAVKPTDFMTAYATGHNCYAVHIGFAGTIVSIVALTSRSSNSLSMWSSKIVSRL
jgi:hypothetical protein